jgi:hypothetical protein
LITTNFDSILRAPGRIGAGVDSAALTVLKKYTRNDDREVLEDAYSNAATKYLTLPIPTIDGIRTILAELSSTVPAAKNADPEQFVSYKITREIEASGFVKRLYEK